MSDGHHGIAYRYNIRVYLCTSVVYSLRVKLISWNVNGLRAVLKKNFLEFLDAEQPTFCVCRKPNARPMTSKSFGRVITRHFGIARKRKVIPARRFLSKRGR